MFKQVADINNEYLIVDPRHNFVSMCHLVERRKRKSLVTFNIVDQVPEMGFVAKTDKMGCAWVPNKYLFEAPYEDQGD